MTDADVFAKLSRIIETQDFSDDGERITRRRQQTVYIPHDSYQKNHGALES